MSEIQSELQSTWQEYLQKSCEVGQLDHHLENLESQKLQLEKQLEVTKRARNSVAHKHDELKKKELEATQNALQKANEKAAEVKNEASNG